MRTIRIRITFGLLATVGAMAMGAIGAASASAGEIAPLGEFFASGKEGKAPPVKLKGHGVGPQEFAFRKLRVTCNQAKVTGSATSAASPTLTLAVSYKECVGGPFSFGNIKRRVLPVKVRGKAVLTYHYAGWIEDSAEVEMLTKWLKCLTDWYPGTYPEKAFEDPLALYPDATFHTEEIPNPNATLYPTGKQRVLLITNNVQGHGLEWEEEGGGACEAEDIELSEGEKGKYAGDLLVEASKGNIEFKAT